MTTRNPAASVRARLLNKARADGVDFQSLLTRYGWERLLYRLSVSRERNNFLLKGALLFDLWCGDAVTPAPESARYPVMFDDMPVPTLRVYPRYTVVATLNRNSPKNFHTYGMVPTSYFCMLTTRSVRW